MHAAASEGRLFHGKHLITTALFSFVFIIQMPRTTAYRWSYYRMICRSSPSHFSISQCMSKVFGVLPHFKDMQANKNSSVCKGPAEHWDPVSQHRAGPKPQRHCLNPVQSERYHVNDWKK